MMHNNDQYLISLNLYEVAGQDRWQNLRKTYYSGSQGLIFIGDLSRKRTFHQIRDFWYEDAKDQVLESIPKLVIANKCDLQEDIEEKELRDITNSIQAFTFLKTSAKDNIGVDKAFVALVTKILETLTSQENIIDSE